MRLISNGSLLAATTTCGLLAAGPALAGGTGMPWESPLQQIVQSVTGPVVQAAAVIAIAIFGGGIAMSETGSALRRGLGILFGLSIAFAASTFFLGFFGYPRGALRAWAQAQRTGLRGSRRDHRAPSARPVDAESAAVCRMERQSGGPSDG